MPLVCVSTNIFDVLVSRAILKDMNLLWLSLLASAVSAATVAWPPAAPFLTNASTFSASAVAAADGLQKLLQHEYKLVHMLIKAMYVHDIHAHTQTCTTHDSQTCVVLEYALEEKAYHVQHTLNSLALSRLLAR